MEFSLLSHPNQSISNEPHVCRDITQLYSSRRVKRSTPESSATRYPLLNEYVQNGLYADYMDRLASCLTREYLSSGSSMMTVQNVNNLMKLATTNLQKIRGFWWAPQSEIFRYGMFILKYLPTRMSTYVRRVLNRPEQAPVADLPKEFQIVAQILVQTSYLHKKDEPFPYNLPHIFQKKGLARN